MISSIADFFFCRKLGYTIFNCMNLIQYNQIMISSINFWFFFRKIRPYSLKIKYFLECLCNLQIFFLIWRNFPIFVLIWGILIFKLCMFCLLLFKNFNCVQLSWFIWKVLWPLYTFLSRKRWDGAHLKFKLLQS